jgi:hypothetical protein
MAYLNDIRKRYEPIITYADTSDADETPVDSDRVPVAPDEQT